MTHHRTWAMGILGILLLGATMLSPLTVQVEAQVPWMFRDISDESDAVEIDDPLTSWTYHDEIDEAGNRRFYRMELEKGDRLKVIIHVLEEDGIIPDLGVWSPGMGNSSSPEGNSDLNSSGIQVFGDDSADGSYEPFTPMVVYKRLELDMIANETGTHWLTIYGVDGHFLITIGHEEEISPSDWVLVPMTTIAIKQWEGQPLILILLPLLVVVVAGLYRMLRGADKDIMKMLRDGRSRPPHQWVLSMGGLMMMGTGVMILLQILLAFLEMGVDNGIGITLIIALLQIGLGASIHAHSINIINTITIGERLRVILMGLFGLVIWAGLIIGPVLVVVGVMMKINKEEPESDRDSMREKSDAR